MATSPSSGDQPPKAAAAVANLLRRRIISGDAPKSGGLATEGELLAELGVSRPTLRAAFRILESEQLITIRRGSRGGAWVNAPTPEVLTRRAGVYMQYHHVSLDELQRARLFLEPTAVRTVAEHARPSEVDMLAAMVERERALVADRVAFRAAALDLHRKLLELAGNKTIVVFGHMLYGVLEQHAAVPGSKLGAHRYGAERNAEHQRVINLIRAGAAAEAQQAWIDHLQAIRSATTRESGPDATVQVIS